MRRKNRNGWQGRLACREIASRLHREPAPSADPSATRQPVAWRVSRRRLWGARGGACTSWTAGGARWVRAWRSHLQVARAAVACAPRPPAATPRTGCARASCAGHKGLPRPRQRGLCAKGGKNAGREWLEKRTALAVGVAAVTVCHSADVSALPSIVLRLHCLPGPRFLPRRCHRGGLEPRDPPHARGPPLQPPFDFPLPFVPHDAPLLAAMEQLCHGRGGTPPPPFVASDAAEDPPGVARG